MKAKLHHKEMSDNNNSSLTSLIIVMVYYINNGYPSNIYHEYKTRNGYPYIIN